jgi:hypothetical protein
VRSIHLTVDDKELLYHVRLPATRSEIEIVHATPSVFSIKERCALVVLDCQHVRAVAVFTGPHEDHAAAHLCGALNSLQRYNRAGRAGRDRCIPHCVCNIDPAQEVVVPPDSGISASGMGICQHHLSTRRGEVSAVRSGSRVRKGRQGLRGKERRHAATETYVSDNSPKECR